MRQESPGLEIRIQTEDRNIKEDSSWNEDGTENPVIILGKSKDRLTNRTHQAEDRIVGLGDNMD